MKNYLQTQEGWQCFVPVKKKFLLNEFFVL